MKDVHAKYAVYKDASTGALQAALITVARIALFTSVLFNKILAAQEWYRIGGAVKEMSEGLHTGSAGSPSAAI